jgi:hypothetical protein
MLQAAAAAALYRLSKLASNPLILIYLYQLLEILQSYTSLNNPNSTSSSKINYYLPHLGNSAQPKHPSCAGGAEAQVP